MHDLAVLGDDLGQPVGLRPPDIGARHGRAPDGNLAHFAHRQGARLGQAERLIGDREDLHVRPGHRRPDAHPGPVRRQAARLPQHQAAADQGHRQGLGGTVNPQQLRLWLEQTGELLLHFQRGGRSSRDHGLQAVQPQGMGCAVARQARQGGRRDEHGRHALLLDGGGQEGRVHLRRARKTHVGDDRRHAQQAINHGEQGEGRQVYFVAAQVQAVHQHLDLGGEVGAGEDRAFGQPGAAAGIDDGGFALGAEARRLHGMGIHARGRTCVRECVRECVRICAGAGDLRQAEIQLQAGAAPAEQSADQVRERRAEVDCCVCFGNAGGDVAQADGGVEHHDHDPRLQQGKHQGEHVHAGRGHQNRSHPRADAVGRQAMREDSDALSQLAVGDGLPVLAAQPEQGGFVGKALGVVVEGGEHWGMVNLSGCPGRQGNCAASRLTVRESG